MNRSAGLRNKLVYLTVIVVTLLPLYLLGQPATDATSGSGGELTQMRADLNLAEANLGEIDPASESMKLENEINSAYSHDDSYNSSYYDSGYEYGYGADPETGVTSGADSSTVSASATQGAEQSAASETMAAATASQPETGNGAGEPAGEIQPEKLEASASANGAGAADAARNS